MDGFSAKIHLIFGKFGDDSHKFDGFEGSLQAIAD